MIYDHELTVNGTVSSLFCLQAMRLRNLSSRDSPNSDSTQLYSLSVRRVAHRSDGDGLPYFLLSDSAAAAAARAALVHREGQMRSLEPPAALPSLPPAPIAPCPIMQRNVQ